MQRLRRDDGDVRQSDCRLGAPRVTGSRYVNAFMKRPTKLLQAPRSFLVRHFILMVECSTSHFQSGSVEGTDRPPLGGGPVSSIDVPFHLCTSARPSQ